jgi:hypothetical protein
MYSKTRLGADQLSGGPKLSRRGKVIVFSVLGVVLAAAIALGVWSAVGSDRRRDAALLRVASRDVLPHGVRVIRQDLAARPPAVPARRPDQG